MLECRLNNKILDNETERSYEGRGPI
jgi:hypothetical protein